MTEQERKDLALALLADELAERVLQKLVDRQKRALVVVTGAAIGVPTALEGLKELRSEGFTYHVLMTRSAMYVTGEEAVRAALEPEELWVESPDRPPEVVAAQFDTILVPALTVNTAAHLACCMSDSPAGAMILSGLLKGKNVVVAVDGACPDNPKRKELGYHMAHPLRDALHENLEKLQAYGARLTSAEDMAKAVRKAIYSFLPEQAAKPAALAKAEQPAAQGGKVIRPAMTGKILSVKAVNTAPRGAVLRVPKGTIVTALASDEARKLGVTIQIES